MSYVTSVLQPGETAVYKTKLSWAMYIPGMLLLAVVVAIFVVSRAFFETTIWIDIIDMILAVVAFFLLAQEWFERWTTEIAVTDRRIIFKRGFIRRDTIEMSVEKVESVDVNQSLLGRLFDFGDVTIRGTGAGLAPLRNIDAPLDFRSHITGLEAKPPAAMPATQEA